MEEDSKKFLIVGLGNAENKYAGTRHNIGFEVVNALAAKLSVTFETGRYAYVAHAKYKGRALTLILPTTYMNLSGNAVRYWLDKEKIQPENMMVISDDLDLPLGTLRMKPKGSGGTHNGLGHIIEVLGHHNFPRLRFGIGHDFAQGYQVDFVLGKFSSEELKTMEPAINKAVQGIIAFTTIGLSKTMNEVNSWKLPSASAETAEKAENEIPKEL